MQCVPFAYVSGVRVMFYKLGGSFGALTRNPWYRVR